MIISPDGGLRLLPFEALYNADKKQYLIQQKDNRYIASGKELVRLFRQQANKTSKNDKAVLFSNPDFGKKSIFRTRFITKQVCSYANRYPKGKWA